MIGMEALQYQNYGGRWYKCGDSMPVKNETDAADLISMSLAKRAAKPAPPPVEIKAAPEIGPAPVEAGPAFAEAGPAKSKDDNDKRYKHREMRPRK